VQIRYLDGRQAPVANIFCIGRNYTEHIRELGNTPAEAPVVFFKPTSALLLSPGSIRLPAFSHDVHYETELVVRIAHDASDIDEAKALDLIDSYALGLDLTARDLQTQAKQQGFPWATAKGFRGSACLSAFRPARDLPDPTRIRFSMHCNGELRQQGDTAQMIYPIATQIAYLSQVFGLSAGDLIYTGTPAGVGPLKGGDQLILAFAGEAPIAHFEVTA